ncbi:SDR family oxidoreductase [Nocardia sp. alder85J]|uniref:SDR family oxidoreductase n=1 Tax=Nocardia sp. alder85J TaxID=2862949 RepID=UPI001CD454B2|nr:SDR family oxidoreductase [Nocardia sp. alder85J]MCX4098698.1 SDR family oxidoreductase [Nocardia sp. alder85J]
MATVLVTGGTGVLGQHIVTRLRVRGHDVRVLSRRAGAGTHVGDLTTGAGVRAAAAGADLIVHAASDFRKFGKPDPLQTRNLLAEIGDVSHLLYVSIVGIDRIPFRYYQRKLACEDIVAGSLLPHTILRATQFHDLIAAVLHNVQRLPVAPLPADFRFQTVAAEDVAVRVAEVIDGPPLWRREDFGGPEVLTLAEMAAVWRARHGGPHRVLPLRLPGAVARSFRAGYNTCPDHTEGTQSWAQYVDSDPAVAYHLR